MGDEHVLYDETSLLEHPQRNILHYHSTPEETPTYLVELPEKRIDAPRPSTQVRSRPRESTIVNTLHLADTREAEEQPLENYVRRNISSFRKSLAPDDLQYLTTTQDKRGGEEVVSPATAEEIERDLMDSKKRKSTDSDSVDGYEARRESLPEEKPKKHHRVTYESDQPSEQSTIKPKGPNKSEDSQSRRKENPQKPLSANQNDYSRPRHEVVVMPALEPHSVDRKSPFSKEQKSSTASSKNRPHPPTKINFFVESSDDERGKHHSKRGKHDPSSAKRKLSNDPNRSYLEQGKSRKRKSDESKRGRHGMRESSDSSGNDKLRRTSSDRAPRSRSSSVCLSGESGDNSSDPHMVNSPSRKDKHRDQKRTSYGNEKHHATRSPKDRTGSEYSAKRDEKSARRSAEKRGRRSDDFADYNKSTNPFGKEEPYSVHHVTTQGGAVAKKPQNNSQKSSGKSVNKSKDQQRSEKRDGKESKKVPLKAPRSATKVVAKRRYHIQIPEHGAPETWFNVRFNMNAENNVDMNYDGPVKIDNYYASNNYL